jgi:hypothetical protein
MSEQIKLFSNSENQQALRNASIALMAVPNSQPYHQKSLRLAQTLRIIAGNGEQFDSQCQVNIRWIGEQLISYIRDTTPSSPQNNLDIIISLVCRFILEFDLSTRNDLSLELNQFKSLVADEYDSFSSEARRQIDFARLEMPLAILKQALNSDELGNLRNVTSVIKEAEKKIDSWQSSLKASEERVEHFQEILSKQKDAFNFVGLHQGFANLASQVTSELSTAQRQMMFFGVFLLLPSIFDIAMVSTGIFDVKSESISKTAIGLFASITITLLLLYFFRIALRGAEACKAQLVQLRLRMALCAFIQNYAEYSKEIKAKNSDALSKFEALIFSGIVVSDEKLPSTFDGIEQLTALVNSMKRT